MKENIYRINVGIQVFDDGGFITLFDNWQTVKGKIRLHKLIKKVCKRATDYVEEDIDDDK